MKFRHVTIYVKDLEKSLKFYRDIIGLSVNRCFPAGPNMEIAFLGEGNTEVELICDKTNSNLFIGKDISLGFEVDSVDDAIEMLTDMDVRIDSGIISAGSEVKYFFAHDPDGVKIQFLEYSK